MTASPLPPPEFVAQYSEYVKTVLKPTQMELRAVFDRWRDPLHWAAHSHRGRLPAPSPIQRAHARIKRPESVIDKIRRKPTSYPDGMSVSSFQRMDDALGGRVITYFLANLPLVDREVQDGGAFEVSTGTSPVAYVGDGLPHPLDPERVRRDHKQSGYVSVHYIVRLRNSQLPLEHRPWFELQVRTILEDAWAEVEHVLAYKPEKRTSLAVRRQFGILSRQLQATDEHFNFLFEELTRFQEEVTYKDDDPLNAENLPAVLAELGIGCSQNEIDGMLKLLASRGVAVIGALRKACSVHRLGLIRNTHRTVVGRDPRNFEIVASVAAIHDANDEEELLRRIKEQIVFLREWDKLREVWDKRRG